MAAYLVRNPQSGNFLGVRSDWRTARPVWVINRKDAVVFNVREEAEKVAATFQVAKSGGEMKKIPLVKCPECKGEGHYMGYVCRACAGSGKVRKP
jgi:hypothetical protein